MIIVLFEGGGCCGAGEVPDRVWRGVRKEAFSYFDNYDCGCCD